MTKFALCRSTPGSTLVRGLAICLTLLACAPGSAPADASLDLEAEPRAALQKPSPKWLGNGATWLNPKSNTALYQRRLKVNRVRIFSNYLQGGSLRGFVGNGWGQDLDGHAVGDINSFRAAVTSLRADPRGKRIKPIRWDAIDAALLDPAQRSDASLGNLIAMGKAQGFKVVPNIYVNSKAMDLSSQDDAKASYWADLWEYYKYMYSFTRWSVDHGVVDVEMQNEPDHFFDKNYAKYRAMFMVAGLAMNHAKSDTKATLNIVGPVVAGMIHYNPFSAALMHDFTTGFAGIAGTSSGSFDVYSYHRYDATGPDHAGIATTIAGNVNASAKKTLPLYVTEMNAHTAAVWDTLKTNTDTPAEASRLASQLTNLVDKVDGIAVFSFGDRASTVPHSGINKNGLHTLAHSGSPYNVGGASRSAEAYRLYLQAFSSDMKLYDMLGSTAPSNHPVMGSSDADHYYVYAVNDTNQASKINLKLANWKLPDTTPVIVSRVDAHDMGEVSEVSTVRDMATLRLPASGIALLTMPRGSVSERKVYPAGETVLEAGDRSAGHRDPADYLLVRSVGDGVNGNIAVSVLQFDGIVDDRLSSAILQLTVSKAQPAPQVLHVYAFARSQPIASLSWANSGMLLPLANGIKVDQIARNFVNYQAAPMPYMVGNLHVDGGSGQVKGVDLTDVVKAFPKGFNLMLVREFRSDGSNDNSVPRDQLGGPSMHFYSSRAKLPSTRPVLRLFGR